MLRVALLERQALLRDGLVRQLRRAGFHVDGAYEDPLLFVEALRSRRPDVAVVEIDPDHPLAFFVIESLREFHPDVRILVLCHGMRTGLMERCAEAGVDGLNDRATQGFDELVTAVHRLAAGERVLPASAPLGHPWLPHLRTLTPREVEVLRQIAVGSDNLKISALLGISERTVKAHVSSLYRKLRQRTRLGLSLCARHVGKTANRPVQQLGS